MVPMYRQEYLHHLRREIDAFAAALARAVASPVGLDLPVVACPGWTVRELAHHLGEVERWVVHAVETGSGRMDSPEFPADEVLQDWYAQGSTRLLATLDDDPEAPAWTFAEPRSLAFWQRRQPHEHAIHRWDLETAIGEPGDLDPALSADGIDEVVTTLWPRQLRLCRAEEPTQALEIVATDVDGRWQIGRGDPVATLSGPASGILLALWRRLPSSAPGLTWNGAADDGRAVLDRALAP